MSKFISIITALLISLLLSLALLPLSVFAQTNNLSNDARSVDTHSVNAADNASENNSGNLSENNTLSENNLSGNKLSKNPDENITDTELSQSEFGEKFLSQNNLPSQHTPPPTMTGPAPVVFPTGAGPSSPQSPNSQSLNMATFPATASASASAATATPAAIPMHAVVFGVVQDKFVLDNATIKNARIIEDGGMYKGLFVELKPQFANLFGEITKAGVGRQLNIVFNQVVITTTVLQTALTGSFLISGISRQDAQTFLNVLNSNKANG